MSVLTQIRGRKNLIKTLKVGDCHVDEVAKVKGAAKKHFEKIYQEDFQKKPMLWCCLQ